MKKFVPLFLFLAVVLVNAFMVYSLKHDRLPFLNTKSVEAMAWEEMINPYWEDMKLFRTECTCLVATAFGYQPGALSGETLRCSYYDTSGESCGNNQQGLGRCYANGQIGTTPLCDLFIWLDADGTWYIHP